MITSQIPARAQQLLGNRPTANLIADYLALEVVRSEEAPRVRGWIMDTLESRGDLGLLAIALDLCPGCWAEERHCDCEVGA